jgi:hypothetical protein
MYDLTSPPNRILAPRNPETLNPFGTFALAGGAEPSPEHCGGQQSSYHALALALCPCPDLSASSDDSVGVASGL